MALGIGITRIGCFLNGCCFGTPTDQPWGVAFPKGSIPWHIFGDTHLHPSQLYSSLYGLGLFPHELMELAYLGELGDRVSLAGPMLSDDGESMVGSVLIIEAESADEIEAIAAGDPYALAGLFEKVTIRPFRQVIPGA